MATTQLDSSRWSRLLHQISHQREAIAFWTAAILYVVPVSIFPYFPTQDGPAHLNNAQILKDYGDASAGYAAFFELRADPLPNLTSHLLLAALMVLLPPLVAEKFLVSLIILGFAGSFRWFLGAFGPRCQPLAWVGLLLVYNRCLWMGFYNYCLSLILIWIILGCCVRWRGRLHMPQMGVLMAMFMAAYFTHLVGFLLAVAGAFAASLLVPPRRVLAPFLIGLAALPAGCLAMAYFEQTGFFQARSALQLFQQPLDRLRGQTMEKGVWDELCDLDNELVAHHAGPAISSSLILLALLGLLTFLTLAGSRRRPPEDNAGPGWLFPAVFALLLLGVYLLVPNHLGFAHGGFLKCRLALLPPLLWLACLREPPWRWPRLGVRAVILLLVSGNLLLVTATIRAGNRELEQYNAGIAAVGRGHRLYVVQTDPQPTPPVDPLLHAADYYCLGTGNVNLDNYEASTPHFPVKYRAGVERGRGGWIGYSGQEAVDVILCWQPGTPGAGWRGPAGWDEIFRQGALRIYRRPLGR